MTHTTTARLHLIHRDPAGKLLYPAPDGLFEFDTTYTITFAKAEERKPSPSR